MENKICKLKCDRKCKNLNEEWVNNNTQINLIEGFYKLIYEEIEELNNEKN